MLGSYISKELVKPNLSYFYTSVLLVSLNLLSVYTTGYRIQGAVFIMLCARYLDMNWMNFIHVSAVLFHDYIHQVYSYFTICETNQITIDEYWHVLYVAFLYFRVRNTKPVYSYLFLLYIVLTVSLFAVGYAANFWLIYVYGFSIAYILLLLENDRPKTFHDFACMLIHAYFSMVITTDNTVGRLLLPAIPAGSAFYAEALIYGSLDKLKRENMRSPRKPS